MNARTDEKVGDADLGPKRRDCRRFIALELKMKLTVRGRVPQKGNTVFLFLPSGNSAQIFTLSTISLCISLLHTLTSRHLILIQLEPGLIN